MQHDGAVHDPMGGNSYVFKKDFIPALLYYAGLANAMNPVNVTRSPTDNRAPKKLIVHIGAQPNNSPHIGTIVTFATAFHIVKRMKEVCGSKADIHIHLDLVDTAPDSDATSVIEKGYQRSLRFTGLIEKHLDDYKEILRLFSQWSGGVEYLETDQSTLNSLPTIRAVISEVLKDRERLGMELAPETRKLALRVACPLCGKSDKHGLRNEYLTSPTSETQWLRASSPESSMKGDISTIKFYCVDHGQHTIDLYRPADL
ncbi:hypothetical protein HDU67_008989, partial [Dinochytrium kinnereticum]